MPMLRKTLSELTPADLQALCDAGAIEDEQIDFKETVPFKGLPGEDPWRKEKRDLSEHGREQVLAALVGFANSYGGDLIIGIRDGGGKAGRAESIAPVPYCEDLAHRLAQLAAACIDPPLPNLQVQHVVTDGSNSGVVIMRTARSRLSPHRELKRNNVYQRSRHETRPLSMRQIQDLTLSAARGLERVERRFADLAREARDWSQWHGSNTFNKRALLRVTAVPLDSSCYAEAVHAVDTIRPVNRSSKLRIGASAVIDLHSPIRVHDWRPALRGTFAEATEGDERNRIRLYCDGALTYEWRHSIEAAEDKPENRRRGRTFILYPEWVFALVVNGMKTVDAFRQYVGQPSAEYGLEVEIAPSHPLPIMMANSQWSEVAATIPGGQPIVLPRVVVGPRADWSPVLTLLWRDFWNACGVDARETGIDVVA